MYSNKNILAVIPARGGSKGVPKKNLREINGVPIVCLAAQISSTSSLIDRTVVSTDSIEIINKVKEFGYDAPFKRPEAISGDRNGDVPVLIHALNESEKIFNETFDVILMLQPTSPLRTTHDIELAIELIIDKDYDSVWSVSPVDLKNHPFKQLSLKNGLISYVDKSNAEKIIARQQLERTYIRNGIVYAIKADFLKKQKKLLGEKSGCLVIDREIVNIDTEDDFKRLSEILKK